MCIFNCILKDIREIYDRIWACQCVKGTWAYIYAEHKFVLHSMGFKGTDWLWLQLSFPGKSAAWRKTSRCRGTTAATSV